MPVSNTPSVAVRVPVPTPVQSKKPAKPKTAAIMTDEEKQGAAPQLATTPAPRIRQAPQMKALILPWTPGPSRMQRLPRKAMRFARPANLDHSEFHRQILHDIDTRRGLGSYTSKDTTSSLVYADFLEENDMPEMAQFVRDAANRSKDGNGSYGDPTTIMEYHHQMNPERDTPKQPLMVSVYQGSGAFREPVRDRIGRVRKRPAPTLQISVKSPHPDKPNSSLAFNLDLPVPHAEALIRRLLAEGHPAGNSGAARRMPNPPTTPAE